VRPITTKQKKWGILLKKELFWLLLRIISVVLVQIFVETVSRMKLLEFLGPENVQILVYDVLLKLTLTLYVWLFLEVFRRFVVPAVTTAVSPAIGKFVREPPAKKRILGSIKRYLNYTGYAIAIVSLLSVWAYSYIGTWLIGFLGTGFVIALTFVLGLFTSSVLGNILAYWVLNNTMEFKRGDRVQIGETYGDIVELGFFFTRIKTIKDEIISIPNIAVMSKEVKNYNALKAVIVHVPVTIGYDVDKEDVKRLLIKCAEETEGILTDSDNKPFVLLTDLGKYTVTYEINAYTDRPNELVTIKSNLIDNILREFKKSKIQLLSPTYVALREATP